ncbi:hypothetical protein T069G_06216 [Trichoderma breve]|uniref:Uncharacterized protein n=1 Tax=Trichoderma breve TaxID=2034170 RepID=A0A9W9E6V8_9HYPO|nr:hypothetical protein T069G_06216 [Trichoderma breve]KAJ4861228.1 hypothetical protein T069G_06216 [Trichoderma breve]
MPSTTPQAGAQRPRPRPATTRCQWIAITMIIFIVTWGGVAFLNFVLLAFEAYLDYRVKMVAIAATTTTTITTTATITTITATTTATNFASGEIYGPEDGNQYLKTPDPESDEENESWAECSSTLPLEIPNSDSDPDSQL